MSVRFLSTFDVPLGLQPKAFDDGLTADLLRHLNWLLAQAVKEGAVPPDAVHLEADETVFALMDGSDIAAVATFYATAQNDLFVHFLYVLPVWRRKGAASCLWRAMAGYARQLGLRNLVSYTLPGNAAMAAFYARHKAPLTGHIHTLTLERSPS